MSGLRYHILVIGKPNNNISEIIRILSNENHIISHSQKIDLTPENSTRNAQVVIIDCMDGLSSIKKILPTHSGDKNVLALIKPTHINKSQAYNNGVFDYITSPIIRDELLLRVNICALVNLNILTTDSTQFYRDDTFSESNNKPPAIDKIPTKAFDKNRQLVNKACRYLLENINQQMTLHELARKMCSNRNTLASAFKKTLGLSVFAWLREERMKRSAVLLKSTSLSIQHICFEVGYSDAANFSTAFKCHFGVSPRTYRKK